MTNEEIVDDFIARGDAKGLKEWELEQDNLDETLLAKIDVFSKQNGQWYGNNAQKRGQ